eukprot:1706539-Alexandrium_andersonii.AAC.1
MPVRHGRGEERRPCRALEDPLCVRAAPDGRPGSSPAPSRGPSGCCSSRRDLQGLADALPGGEAGWLAGRI